MPRFFLEAPPRSQRVRLAGREARHALQVFRLREGDDLTLFDGTGWEYAAVVVERRGSSAELEIRSKRRSEREAPAVATLAVAVPRGKKMSQIVRSASELGADRIVPLVTERTVLRLASGPEDALRRWEQIAIEASKQSGRSRVTRVEPPTELAAVLDRIQDESAGFVASTSDEAPPLAGIVRSPGTVTSTVLLLVGPEGDFTPEENEAILRAGVRPFTLGRSILRVETAAISALATLFGVLLASPD